MMDYFIPHDTQSILSNNKDIDNFSLRLNRFVREDFFTLKNEYEGMSFDTKIEKERVDAYYESLEKISIEQESIFVKNSWKLILGMGSGSVYNTSITLHHVYGVPYLPAQSIKGAFRSYIVQSYFSEVLYSEKYEKNYKLFEEEILYKTPWFVDIFGSNDKQGQIHFFDAFSKEFSIGKDIMTPHYGKYYGDNSNKIAPTDTESPVPIKFLVIKDASYKIVFSSKERVKIKEGIFAGKDMLDVVKSELLNSLEIFGIGGKTSVGYGYFSKINAPMSPLERAWSIAKETKDIHIVKRFLKDYPSSKYEAEALKHEKKLEPKKEDKFTKVNAEVEKNWNNIHDPKYKNKLKKALENFIKKWSKEKNNRGSELVLDYVKKAEKELK